MVEASMLGMRMVMDFEVHVNTMEGFGYFIAFVAASSHRGISRKVTLVLEAFRVCPQYQKRGLKPAEPC